jgi:hypothetical protein
MPANRPPRPSPYASAVAAIVATAPPLTIEQKTRLTALLRGAR